MPRRAQAAHPVLATFLVPNPLPHPKTWQLVWFIFALTTFVILGQAGLPAEQHTPFSVPSLSRTGAASRARPRGWTRAGCECALGPCRPSLGLTTNLTQPLRAPLADPEPARVAPSPG